MSIYIVAFFIGFILALAGVFVFYLTRRNKVRAELFEANRQSAQIIEQAQRDAETLKKNKVFEAREEWYKVKKKQEEEIAEHQKELRALEKRYNERLSGLDKRLDSLDKKELGIQEHEQRLRDQEELLKIKQVEAAELVQHQQAKLAEIAQLTHEQALEQVKNAVKDEARSQASGYVKRTMEEARQNATKEAAAILSTAIQRIVVDYVSESTVSVVSLPSDEMKGRIIGREGRNIRAFEKASGVDVIIDDTPEAVVLSCFDPVRREVSRIAMEKLILDGRIHPARIEEVIEKTQKEMEENMIKIGEQACLEVNVHNVNPVLVKLLGRLQYRTSYGQNILQHSIECAWICGILAAELHLDQELARRIGFMHDIGKAIDHEFDGSHSSLGANLARKNGEKPIVVNAIEAHHEEVEPASVYAVLAQVADAVSGARPGARREMLESYMQRLEKLEEIANSIEGVSKSFAIQAGRELRIIVEPTTVDDARTAFIASDIAAQIEREMQYPGQIKVVAIRETRQSAVAK
jgi:ribonuclease Y